MECSYRDLCKYKTGILSARKCNLVTCSSRLPNDACSCSLGGGVRRGMGFTIELILGTSGPVSKSSRSGEGRERQCDVWAHYKKHIFGLFWWWFLHMQLVSLYTEPGSVKEGSVKGLECVVSKSKVCLRNFVGSLNFCGHIIFTNITQKSYCSYSRI
jgi:hypothetical protein